MKRILSLGVLIGLCAGCSNGDSASGESTSTTTRALRRPPDMNKQEWADWHEKMMREVRHRKFAPQTESHLAPVKRHHSED